MAFEDRLAKADKLEVPFIEGFNANCQTHKIFKFGIESTELKNLHSYISSAMDSTSQFIRYLPDSVLVETNPTNQKQSPPSLIEFKVHDTLVETNFLFDLIKEAHEDENKGVPPLTNKQDIFAIETDSLDLQQRLAGIDVNVVVVGWQTPRTIDEDVIRAQYAKSIVTCQTHTPRARESGSGTPMSNVHFGEFVPIATFFEEEFGIPPSVIHATIQHIMQHQNQ